MKIYQNPQPYAVERANKKQNTQESNLEGKEIGKDEVEKTRRALKREKNRGQKHLI